jgi:hypothetical protein
MIPPPPLLQRHEAWIKQQLAANKINNPQQPFLNDVSDEVTVVATIISSSSDESNTSSHIERRSWMKSMAITNNSQGDLLEDDVDPVEESHMRM